MTVIRFDRYLLIFLGNFRTLMNQVQILNQSENSIKIGSVDWLNWIMINSVSNYKVVKLFEKKFLRKVNQMLGMSRQILVLNYFNQPYEITKYDLFYT